MRISEKDLVIIIIGGFIIPAVMGLVISPMMTNKTIPSIIAYASFLGTVAYALYAKFRGEVHDIRTEIKEDDAFFMERFGKGEVSPEEINSIRITSPLKRLIFHCCIYGVLFVSLIFPILFRSDVESETKRWAIGCLACSFVVVILLAEMPTIIGLIRKK